MARTSISRMRSPGPEWHSGMMAKIGSAGGRSAATAEKHVHMMSHTSVSMVSSDIREVCRKGWRAIRGCGIIAGGRIEGAERIRADS